MKGTESKFIMDVSGWNVYICVCDVGVSIRHRSHEKANRVPLTKISDKM